MACIMVGMSLSGCIDKVSFDTERSEGQIIVSGKITDSPGPYRLELGITTESNPLPQPLSGAAITLFNDHNEQESYKEIEEGIYSLPGNIITGTRGDTYHIEINLPDGRTFTSIPETMPLTTALEEVILEPDLAEEQTNPGTVTEVPSVFVYSTTTIPEHEEPLYLKWDVQSLYLFRETPPLSPLAPPPDVCYVTDSVSPQLITLYSTENTAEETLGRHLVGVKEVIGYQFYIRHYFNVINSSITERRYRYWQKVDDVINQTGTIFDVPPASVPGNIQAEDGSLTEAFGYFEASAADTSRDYVYKADFEFYIENPCPKGKAPLHFACGNCLEIEKSSLDRPYYIN